MVDIVSNFQTASNFRYSICVQKYFNVDIRDSRKSSFCKINYGLKIGLYLLDIERNNGKTLYLTTLGVFFKLRKFKNNLEYRLKIILLQLVKRSKKN